MSAEKINKILKEKADRFKIGDDLVVTEHASLLKEIKSHLNLTDISLVILDDYFLQKDIGLKTDFHLLQKTHQEYLCNHLTNYFGGLSFNIEMLYEPYKNLLPFIAMNRKHGTIKEVPKFLGVASITDSSGKLRELNYFLNSKSKADFMEGYLLGKNYPLTEEVYKILTEDHLELKEEVYGLSKKTYQIKTVEGETISCKNLNEVCCWLIARVKNYYPGDRYSW